MDITTDFTDPSNAFLQEQEEFMNKVGDANSTAEVFQNLCMPAMDADHLDMTLPVEQVRPPIQASAFKCI